MNLYAPHVWILYLAHLCTAIDSDSGFSFTAILALSIPLATCSASSNNQSLEMLQGQGEPNALSNAGMECSAWQWPSPFSSGNCTDNSNNQSEMCTAYKDFLEILDHFHCPAKNDNSSVIRYSYRTDCDMCKDFYLKWLWSIRGDVQDTNGTLVPPCDTICDDVMKYCPYIQPELLEVYGSEPTFLCSNDRRTGQACYYFMEKNNTCEMNESRECYNDLCIKRSSVAQLRIGLAIQVALALLAFGAS